MLWQDVLLGYYPISMCLGCLNVRYMSKRYHSNGRWLCITLNCEIIPMCFRIVILSQYVLELWNYPNAFWNCKIIPNTFWNCEIIPMRFGIVILSQCVLELWYYPNAFWNCDIIPIIEFPEVSVPQRLKKPQCGLVI